jgi:aspartate 1-decarboxylase
MRTMLRGKIHRATVTGAELHYEGSVTIDADLLERADILPYEQVDIWDVTNGERFTTYALAGQRGSGVVCINGAAAHKACRGDLVIIAAFAQVSEEQARTWTPRCVFVDSRNHPVELRMERAGQAEMANAWVLNH